MPRRKKRGGSKGLSQYSRLSKKNKKPTGSRRTKSDNFSSLSSLSSDNESTTQYNSKEQAANFSDLVDPETPKPQNPIRINLVDRVNFIETKIFDYISK